MAVRLQKLHQFAPSHWESPGEDAKHSFKVAWLLNPSSQIVDAERESRAAVGTNGLKCWDQTSRIGIPAHEKSCKG